MVYLLKLHIYARTHVDLGRTCLHAYTYAKCDPTYYAPTTHQLRVTYASYTRSTHTFKLQYAHYDTRNTIFLRYEMLSFLCPLPYVKRRVPTTEDGHLERLPTPPK